MNIKFNKKIYTLKAIEKAVCLFKDFALFKIKKSADYHLVELTGIKVPKQDNEKLVDEFCNHVLFLNKA